ncbi:DUF3526 domain-containing protein [Chitinophaga rhizophila]|uniref:DUF3526 domain-containing protein n=1 Tax=Chitinophaga rhizophila TaxID=2866212 RepID=A0ABS7GJ05_9BACT|nr:DUF3526 domain-containing protein [Chitinophaga rhizophila]MBW8687381.1 DUF3526 domain-containing protein [Chitinophaga rhizophila]
MNRLMLQTIVKHEIKLLVRNKVLVYLFSIIFFMLLSALWIGSSMYKKQLSTIRQIKAYDKEITDSLRERITRIEKEDMIYPGFIWDDPTFAYNTARNEGPQFAVKQPFSLQALTVGQSDLQPFYYKVNITRKQYLTYDGEIGNSFLQFIGNFDFAFVVVYLFPLLIIVFTYNVLSSEKEQGTWVLLKTSNQSLGRLITARIAIRYLLFIMFFWMIVTPVLVLLVGVDFFFTTNWWWTVICVSLYFSFWFALSMFINSFSFSSTLNAMTLIFIWLFTGIIVPNLLQIGLNKIYPIPSRISMVTEERNALNQYFEKDGQTLTKEVFNNPRTMIRQASIVTPGMVYGYGVIVYKSQEIKDAAAAVAERKLYGQIERQQNAIQRLQLLSPALLLQEQLSAFAGTHWRQFNKFSIDVDTFRRETQRFYFPKMAEESTFRSFTLKDVDAIPRFNPKVYADYGWTDIPALVLTYIGVTVVLLLTAYKRLLAIVK